MNEQMTRLPWLQDCLPSLEMSQLIAAFPWHDTALGAAARWPASLHCAMGIRLFARAPSYLLWGESSTILFNDAFAAIVGDGHKGILGRPASEAFPELLREPGFEISEVCGLAAEARRDAVRTFDGGAGSADLHFTESRAPVFDPSGKIVGLLCTCIEMTEDDQVRAALETETNRLRERFQQAPGFMVWCCPRLTGHPAIGFWLG